MLSLGELPGRKITEWHKEFSPTIKLDMGVQTWIMVGDPVLAQRFLFQTALTLHIDLKVSILRVITVSMESK